MYIYLKLHLCRLVCAPVHAPTCADTLAEVLNKYKVMYMYMYKNKLFFFFFDLPTCVSSIFIKYIPTCLVYTRSPDEQ